MKTKILFQTAMLSFLVVLFSGCEDIINNEDGKLDGNVTISENITESLTWKDGNTYIIDGTVRVGASQTVVITVEPGATIKFTNGGTLDFAYSDDEYATIIAKGTPDKPIKFTSNSPIPAAGDWNSLNFYKGAVNCEFENCIFEYGGGNNSYGNIYLDESAVSFKNCSFTNSQTDGIKLYTDGRFSSFTGNSFSNIGKNSITCNPSGVSSIGANNSYDSYSAILINDVNFNKTGEFTWKNQGVPYIIDGSIRMGVENTQGLKLIIEPGVVFKMTDDSYIDFAYWDDEYVTLIAKGTAEKPIVFTSNSPSPEQGDWNSLNFYKGAVNCEFDFCEFRYGGGNNSYGNIYISETAVSITNCLFSKSESYGVKLYGNGEFANFTNNTFSSQKLYPVTINANAVATMGANNSFETGSSIHITDNNFNISGSYTWLNQGVPYFIDGTIRVGSPNGTTLNINAGTVLKFANGGGMQIAYWDDDYAKLITNGTATEPVVFTSNSPAPAKGDWDGISFYQGVSGSNLNYCTIDYAGGNTYMGAVSLSDSGNNTITIANSTISNSESYGITVDSGSSVDYSTVTFINNNGEDYHVR